MTGRKPKLYLCPNCLNPATRAGHGSYFDCDDCEARLVLKNGELQEARPYNPRLEDEKGRVRTYLTADGFEELVGQV